ncbi:MAG: NAD(+) diphosphatase [Marinobacter sp.]|nr:NAD(+) diphosphatase [Marinobacter sp.]
MADWTAGWSRQWPEREDGILALSGSDLLTPDTGWLHPWETIRNQLVEGSEPVYVGKLSGQAVYVADVKHDHELHGAERISTREAVLTADDEPAAMIGTALQVHQWWRDHRFCGRCGQPTGFHPAERARWCDHCGIPWYARLAPCVIVVIRRGDQFLLARSSRTRRHFFSLIAGFVEPGESAEQAVAREVMEETGLQVANVRYRGSQPWPFPHQLMLGYFADYVAGDLVLQEDELAEAGWYAPGALPPVPPDTTIAGRLIRRMEREITGEESGH